MNHTEMVEIDQYDLPPDYKERIFGATSMEDFWNPHQSNKVAVQRPFVSFEEYQSMMGEAYFLEDYRSVFELLKLAIRDAQWVCLYGRVSK